MKKIISLLLCLVLCLSVFSSTGSPATANGTLPMMGDVSGDNRVSSLDALMALQAASALITLNDAQKQVADINGDGNISSVDALMVLQFSVGLIVFPQRTKLYGVDFGPYVKPGQNPNYLYQVSAAQMHELIDKLVPYTKWVRTFSAAGDHANIGQLAHEHGLKVAVGAWLGRELFEDEIAANQAQINGLIAQGQAGNADLLIVGSETLLRGDLTEQKLIDYINQVKAAVPSLPVATADVYGELIAHPAVIAAGDVVLPNFYPYWEGVSIDNAPSFMYQKYNELLAVSGGKQIILSEAGWPSEGNTIGLAVPSIENAAKFLMNFVSFAEAENIPYFYFEAFDEPWKYTEANPQEAHWGLWTNTGVLKDGMQATFDGERIEDNWSGDALVGGPGTPSCIYTYVPPYGGTVNTYLQGQVLHVRPSEYKVVTYIKVGSGWWVKPYAAWPTVEIGIDGSWACDTYTGGYDYEAVQMNSYLIPAAYDPPILMGAGSIPADLITNAVTFVTVTRSP